MIKNFFKVNAGSRGDLNFAPLLPLIALYYCILIILGAKLSAQAPSLFAPIDHGLAFNSMLEHLLHGTFDVDPRAIGDEGFLRDGKIYAYFGVFAALLRLPLALFGALKTTDVTVLSCLVAALVLALCQVAAILMVWRAVPSSGLSRLLGYALIVTALLSGPQITFLKPSIYQEVVLWANAMAAGFVCCAVYGIFVRGRFGAGLLTAMAILAGLSLNTRVSTAVGLYAASGLLLGRAAWLGSRDGVSRRRDLARLLAPAGALVLFAAFCALVNYERWGNPLVFADLHRNLIYQRQYPERLLVLAQHGEFNPARIGYGLLYYFLPIWAVPMRGGGFLFEHFRHRFIDSAELPPASLLLSDPFIVAMAAVGIVLAWRWRRRTAVDTRAVALLGAGLTLPVLLILMAISMTFRYRGEFYPLLQFLSCAGLYFACAAPGPGSADPRASTKMLATLGCIMSILGSHLTLAMYDLSPFGPAKDIVARGSVADFYMHRVAQLFVAAQTQESRPR